MQTENQHHSVSNGSDRQNSPIVTPIGASIHIGPDFKGMEISAESSGFVEFTMDNERDYMFIDAEEAVQIIQHLTKTFDLTTKLA